MEVSAPLVISGLSLVGSLTSVYWAWQARFETSYRETVDAIADMHITIHTLLGLFNSAETKFNKLRVRFSELPESEFKTALVEPLERHLKTIGNTMEWLNAQTAEMRELAGLIKPNRFNARRVARHVHELRASFRKMEAVYGSQLRLFDDAIEFIEMGEQRIRDKDM